MVDKICDEEEGEKKEEIKERTERWGEKGNRNMKRRAENEDVDKQG